MGILKTEEGKPFQENVEYVPYCFGCHFSCIWIFLFAFNGATSCQPMIDVCCIKSAYLCRDYLTLQGKQLTPYFLTDVHCHRKMMYFYECFCFPQFWRVSVECWISQKIFPITCFSPKWPVIHTIHGALAASISWDCVCSLAGKLKLFMKTWMSPSGFGPFCKYIFV